MQMKARMRRWDQTRKISLHRSCLAPHHRPCLARHHCLRFTPQPRTHLPSPSVWAVLAPSPSSIDRNGVCHRLRMYRPPSRMHRPPSRPTFSGRWPIHLYPICPSNSPPHCSLSNPPSLERESGRGAARNERETRRKKRTGGSGRGKEGGREGWVGVVMILLGTPGLSGPLDLLAAARLLSAVRRCLTDTPPPTPQLTLKPRRRP